MLILATTEKFMDDVDVDDVSLEPKGTECIDGGSGCSHGNSWMMSVPGLKMQSALMLVLTNHMET